MRKFLSILMLACLLCGLALPAGAEGEPQLYVKVGDNACTDTLIIPKGLTRTVSFYTDETGSTPLLGAEIPTSSDSASVALTSDSDGYKITALKTTSDAAPVSISLSGYLPVLVNVPDSSLEIKKADGAWGTSLDLMVDDSVGVELRLGAGEVFDSCTDSVTVPEGLTLAEGKLTANSAGTFELSYQGYTVTVRVTTSVIPIDKTELSYLQSNDDTAFRTFLMGKGYSGSGDCTLQLPAENLGNVTCNVQLPGDAILTIKGASGKTVTDFTVGAKNIFLDGITFTGSPALTVTADSGCIVSNSKFSSPTTKFSLLQDTNGNVPVLTFINNTYGSTGRYLASIVDSLDNEVGQWLGYIKTKPETATVDFGVKVESGTKTIKITALGEKKELTDNGWTFEFKTACDFDTAFVSYNRDLNVKSSLSNNKIQLVAQQDGEYLVVKGSAPPALVKKNDTAKTLTITDDYKDYLKRIVVPCNDFKAVKVTDSKGNSVAWEKRSDGNLVISLPLTINNPFTITNDTDTKTVTKASTTTTKTTSRSYNHKYQDYYLITPQRVTDRMRYAKDNLVTIECKEAGRRSISLPVASMAAAAEKGYSILLKNEKIANITMDPAALKSMAQQAKGTTVLLHYRSLNHKTLTSVGLASVQSHLDQFPNDNADLAFLLTATSDSETIEDLQLGTITLKIPFIVLPGTEEMKNEVYALQSETSASARETTVADGHLTTKLTDLTEHMVFQIGEPVETTEETTEPTVETTAETTQPETEPETVPETTAAPEPVEEEKGFPVWIPIVAVLLLAGGGAAAWFLYFCKRFKK